MRSTSSLTKTLSLSVVAGTAEQTTADRKAERSMLPNSSSSDRLMGEMKGVAEAAQ